MNDELKSRLPSSSSFIVPTSSFSLFLSRDFAFRMCGLRLPVGGVIEIFGRAASHEH
jgi:hypothetical protein